PGARACWLIREVIRPPSYRICAPVLIAGHFFWLAATFSAFFSSATAWSGSRSPRQASSMSALVFRHRLGKQRGTPRRSRPSRAVVCLISALAFHDLTTQVPHEVSLAIPRASEPPRIDYPPVRVFRISPAPFAAGVAAHRLDGVPVRVYSREKTLADCFKYRNT